MRLMDGATAALDSGDARLALTLLDRHDLEFLHGQMAPEALELRIRAYGLRHDDAKVVELGRAFLSRYPDNPLVPRVRALIGESERR
jgi:outer membrane protein assembly factor BamD (BamD/ComL family)